MNYQLTNPWWLAAAALPLALLLYYLIKPFIARSVPYPNPVVGEVPRQRYDWAKTTLVVGMCLVALVLAPLLAKPTRQVDFTTESRSVMLVFDDSLSMNATDVAPSRVEAAMNGARDFIARAPADMQIGLVVYGAKVDMVVPITTDRGALQSAVDNMSALPDDFRSGTNTGEAIQTALTGLASVKKGLILLVSDGKETTPIAGGAVFLPDAAQEVKEQGFVLSSIAYGTAEDQQDAPDPEALKAAALTANGQFYTAASAAELDQALQSVPLVEKPEQLTVPLFNDTVWYILLAAFGLLVLLMFVLVFFI